MARSLVPLIFEASYPAPRAGADPFLALHREMNRMFDDALRGSSPAGAGAVMAPRMNVSETAQAIHIEVELPGVSEKDVHVELADDVLTIRGEKRTQREDAHHHVVERSSGTFSRSVRLPFAAKPDQVQASFTHGVLTVTLPKSAAEARVHRIQVQPSGNTAGDSQDCQGAPAATAGHPTPDTTQGRPGQGSAPGSSEELNTEGQVRADPVLDNPGPGHPT